MLFKILTTFCLVILLTTSVDPGTNNSKPSKCGKRIIGYYPSWGTSKLSNEQASYLTHIYYAFLPVSMDGTISEGDYEVKGRLQDMLLVAKKFPHLKVLFVVGGWTQSYPFSTVAADPAKRQRFVESTIALIKQFGFHGIDIDWEHPVSGGPPGGTPGDRDNYVALLKELRDAFNLYKSTAGLSEDLLISFSASAGLSTLKQGYNLQELMKYADFVNAMTYDYFGAWDKQTGSLAPLYNSAPAGVDQNFNVDSTIRYYLCNVLDPKRINLGIPFYGRVWYNVPDGNGPWRTSSPLSGGEVIWSQIAMNYNYDPFYDKLFDEKAQASYMYNKVTKTFIGYDSPRAIDAKIKYTDENNLGGLMVWSIDQDDISYSQLKRLAEASICSKAESSIDNFAESCSQQSSSSNENSNASDYNNSVIQNVNKPWYDWSDGAELAGKCGPTAPRMNGIKIPICNPNSLAHCCSKWGFCGASNDHCNCDSCVDFSRTPNFRYEGGSGEMTTSTTVGTDAQTKTSTASLTTSTSTSSSSSSSISSTTPSVTSTHDAKTKLWWNFSDGWEKNGSCGPNAPKINGMDPICNPNSAGPCCSAWGQCGASDAHCKCTGCVDYRQ